VLFNEPKLLKRSCCRRQFQVPARFSALQRAEIAENARNDWVVVSDTEFQCSSTSRNC